MGPPPVPVRPSITTEGLAGPSSAPSSAGGRSLRKRNTSLSKDSPYTENDDFDSPSERAMRSANRANLKPWTPKLKLKVSSATDNRNQSFLGPYDRELDSEDEDLVFEEQFILRLPSGKDTDKLREVVSKRGVSNDIWFKFKGWSKLLPSSIHLTTPSRLETRSLSYGREFVPGQTCGPTVHPRVSKDTRQQAHVQSQRHLSGTVAHTRI